MSSRNILSKVGRQSYLGSECGIYPDHLGLCRFMQVEGIKALCYSQLWGLRFPAASSHPSWTQPHHCLSSQATSLAQCK